jgi:hypothetical protein
LSKLVRLLRRTRNSDARVSGGPAR